MTDSLAKRIAEGEGLHLDFKYAVSDSKKIARSIAAFANTEGGSLLLGVKDNGRIAGINSDEEYYMIETAAHIFCKPEVKFDVKRWEVQGKVVLEIVIGQSNRKPHTAPDKEGKPAAFIRIKDENLKIGSIHAKHLKQMCSKPNPVNFTDRHQKVVDFLVVNGPSTFSSVWKQLLLSTKEAERLLLDLLSVNIISVESTHNSCLFYTKRAL